MNLTEQVKREKVLVAIYKMADGNPQATVETVRLTQELKMDHGTTLSNICGYLREEGYITWGSFSFVSITHVGRKKAERLMNLTYAEKEARVLQMLYEMSGPNNSTIIGFSKLVEAVNIGFGLVSRILTDFSDRRNYVDWGGGDVIILRTEGIEAYEGRGQTIEASNVNIIHMRDNYGQAASGQNINQTMNVNPEFDQAVTNLIKLVQSSVIDSEEKEDLREEILKVTALATREPATGLLDKAKSRMETIKVGLQAANLLTIGLLREVL